MKPTEFAPQLKLLHHPTSLLNFLEDDYRTPPVQVEISPTNSCPAKCDWCFYVSSEYKQRHSEEHLDFYQLRNALDDMAKIGVQAVSWTGGGDPSSYAHIDEAIDFAHVLGLKQGIFTNAYKPLASPEKLSWIRITITEKFILTKHIERYARATKVGVNFNLCEENKSKLSELATLSRKIGVRYFQVRPALADRADLQKPVDIPYYLKELETENFRVVLTDYKWDDYLETHGYPICHGHRFVPFLWHNGDLAVCAYHFGRPDFTFGNIINDGGFTAVWYGNRRREMVEKGVGVIRDCQHCCKLHEINKPLAILRGELETVNDKEFL